MIATSPEVDVGAAPVDNTTLPLRTAPAVSLAMITSPLPYAGLDPEVMVT